MSNIGRNEPCPCGSGKKYKQCCQQREGTRTAGARAVDFSIPKALQAAMAHQQSGRFPQAEAIYKQILQVAPNQPDALHLLGTLALQVGRSDIAVELIRKAIHANPSDPVYYGNLGNAFKAQGKLDAAVECYYRVISLKPDSAEAYNNLGAALQKQGKLDTAIGSYQKALSLKPDYADAHYNLGLALQGQGKLDTAVKHYRHALSLRPNYAEAYCNLGVTLQMQGSLDAAVGLYNQALAFKPNYAEAYCNLGAALQAQGKLDAALESLRHALAIKPDDAETHSNMGNALKEQGRLDEAAASFRKALTFKPDFAEARWKLAMVHIPIVADTSDEIKACRAGLSRELAELDTWFDSGHAALGYKAVGTSQPYYLAYQEENNRDILLQYGVLCARLMKHWQDTRAFPSPRIAPGNAIRVGIVSAHIRSQSVWDAIVKGWLQHLNRDHIELHVFHVGFQQDEETNWAKSRVASFEQGGKSLELWVNTILEKQADMLIYPEIGMDPTTVKLASLRLAPIQVAAWGHPETTGLPTMDYYLSAELFEPQDAQNNYTEQLIRLPHLGCHYLPAQVTSSDPDLASLGITVGVPLLLCPGVPFKYAPQHDGILVEIARKLGRCQFVFFTYSLRGLSEKLRQRLELAFARAGMHFNDYCVFIPWQDKPAFYGLMKRADVFLDTIGFSGFNTAMQAVECGLPIVTKEGRFMRGRLASGVLRRMGVTELIANSGEEYVNLAVRLAQDADYRRDIRQRIASSRPVLFDDVAPVHALEDFIINSVKRR